MSHTTLTRSEICTRLSCDAGLSRHQAAEVLEMVLENVVQGLAEKGLVKISSFGTFYIRQKNERVGRNPKTGEEMPIAPRRSLSFRASPVLKQKVERIR